MVNWPPRDPLVYDLQGLLDGSPHSDWLTSGQRVMQAEKILAGLGEQGWEITRPTTCLREKGHPGLCRSEAAQTPGDRSRYLWWEDISHGGISMFPVTYDPDWSVEPEAAAAMLISTSSED
jgi:hypothetical protein